MKTEKNRIFKKRAVSVALSLAVVLSFLFPGFFTQSKRASAAVTVDLKFLTDGTNYDDTKNTAVNLRTATYNYSDGKGSWVPRSTTSSDGHYRISGSVLFTDNGAPAAPILVRGGGEVWLELDAATIGTAYAAGNSQRSMITILENTTLHLSWTGANTITKTNITNANVFALIGISDGSTLILEGGEAAGDSLAITVPAAMVGYCPAIGPDGYGTVSSYKQGGDFVMESGKLTVTGAGNSAAIGGSQYSYLKSITVNGGEITGNVPYNGALIGGGRNSTGAAAIPTTKIGGTITVNGGTISGTTRGGGALIGGGWVCSPELIKITGGVINASSVSNNTPIIGGGVGLDANNHISGGKLEISGGIINITGNSDVNQVPVGAGKWGELDYVEITGGIITVDSGNAGKTAVSNIGEAGSGTKKVIVGPAASIKITQAGSANTALTKAGGLQGLSGEDVFCTAITVPIGYLAGMPLKINGNNITFEAAHSADSAYYLYLPEEDENELEITVGEITYEATVASGGSLSSSGWQAQGPVTPPVAEAKALTELNGTDKSSVVLEKDGYTYNGSAKALSNGEYSFGGSYTLTNNFSTVPITVTGGGDVYLELESATLKRDNSGDSETTSYSPSLIIVTGGTKLHLTIKGENKLESMAFRTSEPEATPVYRGADSAIRLDGGSELILESGEANAALLIDSSKGNYASCIGPARGSLASPTKGGKFTVESGRLETYGGTNTACIGGNLGSYLELITINGGEITGQSQYCGAVIGGGRDCGLGGALIINGGTIDAAGAPSGGSAIGGGSNSMLESIIINDGIVNAVMPTGALGAAIGGGWRSGTTTDITNKFAGGSIVINGGTVVADASDGLNTGCAGIGGAPNAVISEIKITGGNITAAGSPNGAGIGTGRYSAKDSAIIITGGTITATGGEHAPGIGLGRQAMENAACDITISGGTVTATGGTDNVAIGFGREAGGIINLKISGGAVVAKGGSGGGGAAIGVSYFTGLENGERRADAGGNDVKENIIVEITGGVVTANGSASCIDAIGFGSPTHNDCEYTVVISDKASVRTSRVVPSTGLPDVYGLTDVKDAFTGGRDVFCTQIQLPSGAVIGNAFTVNNQAYTFPVLHPSDLSTYYLYLPANSAGNTLTATVNGVTYYALMDSGQRLRAGDWSTDPANPGRPGEEDDEDDDYDDYDDVDDYNNEDEGGNITGDNGGVNPETGIPYCAAGIIFCFTAAASILNIRRRKQKQ